ncbi:MAG: hypothetical protein RBR59_09195 [Sulfurimonadaceae bacterium]|nr:hypothetical protein [Sulfurimonadaceae bacterium]
MTEISLKKDEYKKILVKYGRTEKLFKMRWTLYHNGGLVVLRSYDQIVAQNVLSLQHKNQSFRVELKPRGANILNVPYFLVKFKAFDFEKNEALFELYLSDKQMVVLINFLE